MGSRVQILGTNLRSFEANSILELDPALHLGSSNHWLSLLACFLASEPIDFPSKMVMPCKFSLELPLFGFGLLCKGQCFNLQLSSNRIPLFHWTLDLGPSSKVALCLAM
jgi:hypothetical protein